MLCATIQLNEMHDMSANKYSLASIVSYLETVLRAVGQELPADVSMETRESLRERFRKASRLLARINAKQALAHDECAPSASSRFAWLGIGHRVSEHTGIDDVAGRQPHNCFAPSTTAARGAHANPWADFSFTPSNSTHQAELHRRPALPTSFAKAHPMLFDVAMRVAVDGFTCVYAAVMSLWSERHDVGNQPAAGKRQHHRRSALDRLSLALMRVALGFFGSHKVDARNNP